MIAWIFNTSLGRNLVAIGAVIGLILSALSYARWTGGQSARQSARNRAARAERNAHERMNHAPDLSDASDLERRDWLRAYAQRHRNN